ncbi:MAG: hypothetical protein AAF126_03100 [Chloroflexota bacterium]
MTTPRLPYNYDNSTQRWRDPNTGRFVSEDVVVAEMRTHVEATYSTLDSLTERLYSGSITVQQWQVAVASELKDAHLAQSMFANGGRNNMTPVEYGRVGGVLADEYRYLQNFAEQIARGEISEAQARARIRQYGNATKQSYWREYTQRREYVRWNLQPGESCADCIALDSGGLDGNGLFRADELPTVPGAGDTVCRGNCNCILSSVPQSEVPFI